MPYKDAEKRRACTRKWNAANPEVISTAVKKFRDASPGRVKEISKKYKSRNRGKLLAAGRVFTFNRKVKVLTTYGKDGLLQCCWGGCCETDVDILELDHINNDGHYERKKVGSGARFYAWLVKNNFPPGYQTLCCNHNRKKEILRRRELCSTS